MATHNLMDYFEDGIYQNKLKQIEMRKDAMLIVNLQQRFNLIAEKVKSRKKKEIIKGPYYKIKTGENLFNFSINQLPNLNFIYELTTTDQPEFELFFFSFLPNLTKLTIHYSEIETDIPKSCKFNDKSFKELTHLNLSFNNLTNKIFNFVKYLRKLKVLNLTKNKIDQNIPDISSMRSLEELTLSHNNICSHYLNIDTENDLNKNTISVKTSPNISKQNEEDDGFIKELINSGQSSNMVHTDEDEQSRKQTVDNNPEAFLSDWKRLLKTNLAAFYYKLSLLPNLKILNLSHNNIHFFDIDPTTMKQGFMNLERLDLSFNSIEEEIGILLIMNLENIKSINITGNPITLNKTAYENIEYEIFRNKNFAVENNLTVTQMPKYKMKDYKVANYIKFQKDVKKQITELYQRRLKMENDVFIEHEPVVVKTDSNKVTIEKSQEVVKPFNQDMFITKQAGETQKEPILVSEENGDCEGKPYDEFLRVANKCLGKETHYKKKKMLPMNLAYHKLRYTLNTLMTDQTIDLEEKHYMKGSKKEVTLK
jgi:Leucine-rich repeat (LRR) protein/copper chaperone CopZ